MRWILAILVVILSGQSKAESIVFYRFTCMSELSQLEFSEEEIDSDSVYSMSGNKLDVSEYESKYGLFEDDGKNRTHICRFESTGEIWKLSSSNNYFTLYLDGREVANFHTIASRGFDEKSVRRLRASSYLILEICGGSNPPIGCQHIIGINKDGTYNDKTLKKLPIDLKGLFSREPQ